VQFALSSFFTEELPPQKTCPPWLFWDSYFHRASPLHQTLLNDDCVAPSAHWFPHCHCPAAQVTVGFVPPQLTPLVANVLEHPTGQAHTPAALLQTDIQEFIAVGLLLQKPFAVTFEKLFQVQAGLAWQTAIPLTLAQSRVTFCPPHVAPEPRETDPTAQFAGQVQLPVRGQGEVQFPRTYVPVSPFATHLFVCQMHPGVYPHSKVLTIAVQALGVVPTGTEVGPGAVVGLLQSSVSCAFPFTQVFQQAPCLQNEL
jgi:hypothetical protein